MVEIAKRNNVSERTIYRYKVYGDKMEEAEDNEHISYWKNGAQVPEIIKILIENNSLLMYNIEKRGHNIPKLSIWRHYGNKKRCIPTEINKPHA